VPVISILGSGGGFRAMVGLSAVFSTLCDEGIMDCVSYVAGLSGSTWYNYYFFNGIKMDKNTFSKRYLSFLYSHPDFPAKGPTELKHELKDVVSKSLPGVITKGIFSYLLKLRAKV